MSARAGGSDGLSFSPSTLIELLEWRRLYQPNRIAYSFLEAEGESNITYSELDDRARHIGGLLQSLHLAGERALLFYPSGIDYIAAFFGCLYAGVIAVPAYPPRLNRTLLRLRVIAADSQAKLALTTSSVLSKVEPLLEQAPEMRSLKWIATDDLKPDIAAQWRRPSIKADSLAYLQYTSGSTASPKGVMINHRNLLHNCAYIDEGFLHLSDSVSLSWLPHFHDMGLVQGILQPIFKGFRGLLMSPASFLQRPFQWLETISRYRVTHSGGPNFAYDLCVRKVKSHEREILDLSSWTVAYNGAEPIRKQTLEEFSATFEPCGFRRSAFYPAYGLAEATLKVSGGLKQEEPIYCTVMRDALEQNRVVRCLNTTQGDVVSLVSCGRTSQDTTIVIADPESLTLCSLGEVGEIWVSSPSVAQGYWNRAEETERTFRAFLIDTGAGPFLRTGDLGFLSEGEVFVTGRLKELVIIRGRNHYPQDIEQTAEKSHPALRPNSGAAFSIEADGVEQLVIVHELAGRRQVDYQAVIRAIRQAVAEAHEVQPSVVALLKAGEIPKTSSGKIRRGECRKRYLGGGFKAAAEWRDPGNVEDETRDEASTISLDSKEAIECYLAARLAAKLNMAPRAIDVHRPLAEYGLDSMMAVELMHSIESFLGVNLPMATVLLSPTLSELALHAYSKATTSAHPSKVVASTPCDATVQQPLSRGQRALWFIQKMSPESAAYNINTAVRIRGCVDVSALRRSFEAIINRHPCLRATFSSIQGEPIQIAHDQPGEGWFQIEDASRMDKAAISERLEQVSHRPFDLEHGPLLRILLLRVAPDEHILLLSIHHIIADLWSLAVVLHELGMLYEAEKNGRPVTLSPLASRYSDFVRWQEEALAGAEGDQHWSYWQRQLKGDLPALNLVTDRPRPRVQTYRGASVAFTIDAGLTAALKSLSQRHATTLYTTLLAAFQTLLHRYTGQEDILVGSPATGRSRAEFSGVVGYFVNTIVLRANFAATPTFASFLEQAKQTVLGALNHQDFPFALLVKKLQPDRDPSRPPLFQAMFALQKPHLLSEQGLASFALAEAGARLKLVELDLESIAFQQRISQFDITLAMAEVKDALSGSIEYNTDLFDSTTILRMAEHFQVMLNAIASDAQKRVSELMLMSLSEQRRVLVEWNKTSEAATSNTCVHHLFETQAANDPDAIAIEFGDQKLSYLELNERANQLANHLKKMGVGPDMRVAIYIDRSIEMIVAVLAIMKVGGAYVPVNSASPQERLAFVIENSGSLALITRERFLQRCPKHGPKLICVDADWEAIAQESRHNPENNLTTGNLAYVIYTSGSTGKPKGVAIEHGALANYISAANDFYGVCSQDRILQFVSLSFDVSAEEIFTCLTTGARLVLRTEAMMLSVSSFIQSCRDLGLTILNLPTAYWQELTASLSAEDWALAKQLRLVIIGGERAMTEPVRAWQKRVGQSVRLVNEYGPTEATVCSTIWELPAKDEIKAGMREIPIGRPIRNTQAYILDRHLHPVPIGIPGELHLAGDNLARGYIDAPRLTAEKFVPNPFATHPGARLYKTGDIARFLQNGNIEYLGRSDHQVKIRGFRIETGEIEAALNQHPAIRAVVVMAKEDSRGLRRLVAYVIARSPALAAADLRSFLKQKLPDYMVPANFIFLETFPLAPSGKVDRRALPEPCNTRPDEVFTVARTPIEKQLAEIWADVLRVDKIGVTDNFFELGGDSILSIQIIARAKQAGLDLTPKQLFEHPTIADLATVARINSLEELQQQAVTGELPLTPIQCWFFEQDFTDPHHWNMAVMLELNKRVAPAVIEKVFEALIAHHDALRLRFLRNASGWAQAIAEAQEASPFTSVDLSALPVEKQEAEMLSLASAAQASLDLANGPILRVVMFDAGPDSPPRILIITHHLAMDAVSWTILLQDFELACRQLLSGNRIALPRKTVSFKKWAERLKEYSLSDGLKAKARQWLDYDASDVAHLPVDHADGLNIEASAQTISISLTAKETGVLLQGTAGAYHTEINDLLLTALAEAFAKWTGSRSLLVEMEGHGREEIEEGIDLSRTVGWFTTAFPVKLVLDNGAIGARLKSIKEQLRRIPDRGLSYGLLRYLSDDRETADKLRSMPPAEVTFNYLGQFDQAAREGSIVRRVQHWSGQSRGGGAKRNSLLEINGGVIAGRLQFDWTYSDNLHRRTTIERLAQEFIERLRALIAHCRSIDVAGYTPSDFPLAKLDQRTLDRLIREGGEIEDIYPLSSTQQGMLFHSLYTPGSAIYIGQLAISLRGSVDWSAFERAWQQTISRHCALRTTLVWENLGRPLQIVHRKTELPLTSDDWSKLPEAEKEPRFESFLESDRQAGFELSNNPAMRLKLIRMQEDSYRFVWTHHHLLLDGWSVSLLLTEVFHYYEAFRRGQSLRLERSRPYRDYIAWLEQQDVQAAETYWKATLRAFSEPTPLPEFRAIARSSPGGVDRVRACLPEELTSALKSLCRKHHLTLNTLLQAVWAVLLSRYSDQADVVFGTTVSGRPATLAGVEKMIGLFINTLPMRVVIAPDEPMLMLMKKIQSRQVEMRQYEHTPLVEVQRWSEMASAAPLFESILVFENYPLNPDEMKRGLSLGIDAARSYDQTNYPLTVVALPGPRLTLELFYDCGRFDGSTVERMLAHFRSLLSSLAQDAEKRASELSMLSESELNQMIVEWNDTRTAYPDQACIHQLLAQHALSMPDKIAVVFEGVRLSYRELNERANRLAHYLRRKGVGPDQLIGVCIDRSIEMIVGLLAILKAGAAYVPMDPNHPVERLAYMLDDTKLSLLLTREGLLERLPDRSASYICLDKESKQIAEQSAANPDNCVSADNLAYVIYTSGSTGKPKGVSVPHRGVSRLVRGSNYVEFNSDEVFLQLTPLSFDVSTFEIWGSLLNGASLVIYPPHTPMVEEVGEIVQQHKVTTLWLTAPLFHQMIREQVIGLKGVRHLLGGGDILSAASVIDALEHLPGCLVINGYGPTESTTFASCYRMTSRNQVGASVSIGRPIANTEMYVLGRDLNPVAVGAIGEIYIGGAGLARGYLFRPDLTAERFIPSPFGGPPGSRLYRSGDLARLMPDGNIEFLGRADHQVKVRGQRVELTEIESVLSDYPAIKEAAVLARDDANVGKRLVAYFAPHEGATVQTSRLRMHLKNKLPDYMVPSAFVTLDKLPMTSSGKLDRKALPVPDNTRPDVAEDYLAPRNPIEEVVAAIWSEILGIERVGVHDSFFDLGGHSLLATRVVSSVRYIFKVELPLKTLFQSSTVAELSEAIIAHEPKPGQAEKIARILKRMESMSSDNINDKLRELRKGRSGA